MATHYLYFIAAKGANAVKIGVSRNFRFRLEDLQVTCPLELTVEASVSFDDADPGEARRSALNAERTLHKFFETERIRGEWFLLSNRLKRVIAIANETNYLGDRVIQAVISAEEMVNL